MARPDGLLMGLEVRVHDWVMGRHLPVPPGTVGTALARLVAEVERRELLRYFPALEYFTGHLGIDPSLLECAHAIGWLAAELARVELRQRLATVSAGLDFLLVRSMAFTQPRVRPGDDDAEQTLARHYTPDRLRIDIQLDLGQPATEEDAAAIDYEVRHRCCRRFADLEVTYCTPVSGRQDPGPGFTRLPRARKAR
ncbi:MAG: hypothetical protein B7Z66_10855 [Chromatiales bacterium 21-64-14]|nr:MAG: hypothetical protein B7Z66_10855 [Chromatiales bacterium 21-64-14]HQU15613.1 hypothetical protein [Gammaproteobacteria bacterium]